MLRGTAGLLIGVIFAVFLRVFLNCFLLEVILFGWKMGAATKLAFAVFLISCCSGGCGGGNDCQLWKSLMQKLLFALFCFSADAGAAVALEGPSADLANTLAPTASFYS